MSVRILNGDCREVMATMAACSVEAIVTDPPYGLGFMGKGWDHGVPGAEFWEAALRVAVPGAYLLAFGGTRTYHRLVVAIEDAGWEIRDQIGWAFGSGFPKSHNGPWGGTALKPAWEPICVARKPLIGTVEANWKAHGTGALNIDGCRIEYASQADKETAAAAAAEQRSRQIDRNFEGWGMQAQNLTADDFMQNTGRWPANLIHDGSEEVLAAFPQAPGQQGSLTGDEPSRPAKNTYGEYTGRREFAARGDGGSAARFFYCAKADRADRNDGLAGRKRKPLNWSSGTQSPGTFQAPGTDRTSENHHPTVKPTDLMRYLCRLVTPRGGTVLDPFMGSGSTLKAAELEGFSAIGIELDAEYCEIARKRIASDAPLFSEVTA